MPSPQPSSVLVWAPSGPFFRVGPSVAPLLGKQKRLCEAARHRLRAIGDLCVSRLWLLLSAATSCETTISRRSPARLVWAPRGRFFRVGGGDADFGQTTPRANSCDPRGKSQAPGPIPWICRIVKEPRIAAGAGVASGSLRLRREDRIPRCSMACRAAFCNSSSWPSPNDRALVGVLGGSGPGSVRGQAGTLHFGERAYTVNFTVTYRPA